MATATPLVPRLLGALAIVAAVLGAAAAPAPASRPPQTPASTGSQSLEELERLAEQKYAEGDDQGAIALYVELAGRQTQPSERARLLLVASWLEYTVGRWDRSTEAMVRALAVDPDLPFDTELYSDDFVAIYRRSLERVRGQRGQQAIQRINAAVTAMQAGDATAARAELEAALELAPNDPTALYNLSLLEFQQGNEQAAIDGFQRLLTIATAPADTHPEVPVDLQAQTLHNLGLLFYNKGYYEDATQSLELSVALAPGSGAAWNSLGLSRRREGNFEAAAAAFLEARELMPDDPAVINNLALSFMDSDDWQGALRLLEPASRTFKDNASVWFNLGLAQRGAGDLTDAANSLEHTIQLDPGNRGGLASQASSYLSHLNYQRSDYQASIASAQRTLGWRPDSVNSWIYLGLSQQALGDFAAAQDSLQKALDLDPQRADTANNLGNAYFSSGRYQEAEAAFVEALRLDPNLGAAKDNLEVVRQRLAAEGGAPGTVTTAPATAAAPRGNSTTTRATKGDDADKKPAQTGVTEPQKKTKDGGKKGKSANQASTTPSVGLGLKLVDDRHVASGLDAARVVSVTAGGGAALAGFQVGDLILRVDGSPVESALQLERRLASLAAGSRARIDLFRDEQAMTIYLER